LPPLVRFLIAASVVSWIPGATLSRLWLRGVAAGPLEKTVLSFAAGLAAVSLLSWLATLFGLSFDAYAVVIQWLLAAFFTVAAVLAAKTNTSPDNESIVSGEQPLGPPVQRTLVIAAAALAVVCAFDPAQIEYRGDAMDHIGYIRNVQAENSLDPGGVLALSGEGVVRSDPRKGTIHAVVALVSRISAVDPAGAWHWLPVLWLPLALLAFSWFCAAFVPRGYLILFCAALFVMFQGGMGFLYGREITNGQNITLVFYWTIVPLCFRYFSTGARNLLAVLVVVCAGGALIHIGLAAHVAVLLGTVLVFHRWLGWNARRVLRLCVYIAAAVVVIGLWKWVHSVGAGNWIHVHPQGLLYVSGRLFVASPFEILRQYGLVFLGGLVIIPFLLLSVRGWRYARLHVSFAAIPYLICFCPRLAPVFFDRAAYMAFRSILNVPVFAAVVAGVYVLTVWARRKGWAARVATAGILLVWSALFLAPSLDAFARSAAAWQADSNHPDLFERYDDLIRFLRTRPAESVVLSDPITSYLISAATGQRVVAVPGQHGNPNDLHAFERLSDVRNVLSTHVHHSQTAEACERYGVDYVVVNGRQDPHERDYLADWNPASFYPTVLKLTAMKSHFRPVFEKDDIVVLHYYPGETPSDRWIPQRMPVDFGFEEMTRCRVEAPDDEFQIVQVDVLPREVLPGETVTMRIGYEKQDVSAYGLPLVVFIRFDHESIASSQKEYLGEKQVRRARERRGGYLLRFRADHRPFGGSIAPDRWPIGVTFYETFPVKLPAALEPGTYTIQFCIARDTLLPNYTLRDFFYNRDHYSGTDCLTLSVSRQVVR